MMDGAPSARPSARRTDKAAGAAALVRVGLTPRLLDRVQAASYLQVSPGTFDDLVQRGAMPAPLRLPGSEPSAARKGPPSAGIPRWDRGEIDDAIDRLRTAGVAQIDDVYSHVRA